jgi:UDP-N-acetylmuramoyl-L-alanyl-D-glutamate--2,6-diaminopimelate ligase
MQQIKQLIKQIIPKSLLRSLLPTWHKSRAIMAAAIYRHPARDMNVIAITGTNGKTTTASFVGSILKQAGYRYGISSTAYFDINGEITANDTNMTVTNPFQVQKILSKMRRKKVKWVVLEVTSHALDQNRIYGIPILAAVMTNLTQDHLDYHGTMEKYAEAKFKLFKNKPRVIVLNKDDEWFDFFDGAEASEHKLTYGSSADADVRINKAVLGGGGSSFELIIDKSQTFKMVSNLIGRFNVYNAAAAVAVTYGLHIDKKAIVEGVKNLESVPGRMEIIDEGQPFAAIVDYAHTPDALTNILETVKSLTEKRVILVFGATGDRDKAKRPIMGEIAAKMADRIFLTDEEPYSEDPTQIRSDVMKGIEKARGSAKTKEVADRRDAIAAAFAIAKAGDSVLITGMGHQTYMKLAGGKIHWDDREVVREEISKRAKN